MENKFITKLKAKFIQWLLEPYKKREVPVCDFDRIRYEIRPCDVLLIEGQNRISEAIKMVTQSSWSHAALYIGRLHDIEDLEIRKRIRSFCDYPDDEHLLIEGMLGEGTIVSSLLKYELEHIRICRPQGLSHRDAQKVTSYAAHHLGREYNIRATFDLFRLLYPWGILPRQWRSSLFQKTGNDEPDREICSTVIAEAFESVHFPILPLIKRDKERGIEFIPRNPRLFTPRDFDYSPYFEIIKYPLYDLTELPIYKQFPWSEEGIFSDAKGKVYPLNEKDKLIYRDSTKDPSKTTDKDKDE